MSLICVVFGCDFSESDKDGKFCSRCGERPRPVVPITVPDKRLLEPMRWEIDGHCECCSQRKKPPEKFKKPGGKK